MKAEWSEEEFNRRVQERRIARMDAIDRMSPEHRELVHDYGLSVVKALMDAGVTKPARIRHVVETVLNEFSPTRGCYSSQGVRATGNVRARQ